MKRNLKSALILWSLSIALGACGDSGGILPPTISDEPVERYGFSTDEKTVGFINKEGEVAIEPRFSMAKGFYQGLSAVGVKTEGGKIRWGYINHEGKYVVKPKYLLANNFSEDQLALVLKEDSLTFINRRGKEVLDIDDEYSRAQNFSEGLAAVNKKATGKWGYINKKGEVVIEAKFNAALPFSDGLALVVIGTGRKTLVGYIDREGKFALEPKYRKGMPFSENLALVAQTFNRYQIINTEGQLIKENILGGCDSKKGFSEGLLSVKLNKRQGGFSRYLCGYLDPKGNVAIAPEFIKASSFSEGLANVQVKGKWGYINKKGEMVIEPKFDEPSSFKNGLAMVSAKPLVPQAYINKKGEYVWKSVEF